MNADRRLVKKWMREQKRRKRSEMMHRRKHWEIWPFLAWWVLVLMIAACLLPAIMVVE